MVDALKKTVRRETEARKKIELAKLEILNETKLKTAAYI